jgi:tetratricopeptide (TPR) repeat protein
MSLAPELNSLENAGLIQLAVATPDLAYSFRHGLIQDAAYATLLRTQRQAWHLATAEVLEAAYLARIGSAIGEGDSGALPAILAHHFTNAGESGRALRYLVLSGDAAFSGYANLEAVDFYSRALEIAVAPSGSPNWKLVGHLYVRLGRSLDLTSQFPAALEVYRRQEALAKQLGDPVLELASLTARATILSTANITMDVEQGAALLERARLLAQSIGDRSAEARISWTLLLNNTMSGGDVAARLELGERALHLALELDDRELLGFIYNDLWYAYAGAGRWSQALEALAIGREISREFGNMPALCENLTRTAISHVATGSYAAALIDMEEAFELAETANSADFRALAHAFACIVHFDRGDPAQAVAVGQAAIAWGESSSNVTVLIGTRSEIARGHLFLGDLDEAMDLARQAHEVASTRFELLIAWPQAVLIRLHIERGELAQAEAVLAAADDYRDLQRRLCFMVPLWTNMGLAQVELALAQRQFAKAAGEADALIQLLEDNGISFLLPEARLQLGEALLAQGRTAEAQPALATARLEAQVLGSRRLLWPILEALAEAAVHDDTPENAAAYRREAREIVNYVAVHTSNDRQRQIFLASDRVRALHAVS